MRRVRQVLVGVAACALLAACSTEPATDVEPRAATLNGIGVPQARSASFFFQYATNAAALGTAAGETSSTAYVIAPTATGGKTFRLRVFGLQPETAYAYRACSRLEGDSTDQCYRVQTFTTPADLCATPDSCVTGAATDVTSTGATLAASGFTSARSVEHWFRLTRLDEDGATGSDPPFTTPVRGPERLGGGTFTDRVTGLEPDATYRVQACARPAGGGQAVCAGAREVRAGGVVTELCGPPSDPHCEAPQPTGITATGATVLTRGLTNTKARVAFFEYAASPTRLGAPGTLRTPEQPLAAGATSAGATLAGLAPRTDHAFRLCVRDPGGTQVRCLVAGAFTTFYATPPYTRHGGHVRVTGRATTSATAVRIAGSDIDVRSDADGSHPTGTAAVDVRVGTITYPYSGPVTCVNVIGSTAVINAYHTPDPPAGAEVSTYFVKDNGGAGKDTVAHLAAGRDPADCSPASGDQAYHVSTLDEGRAVVTPAP